MQASDTWPGCASAATGAQGGVACIDPTPRSGRVTFHGTDGSTAQDRANAAGFPGTVAETVVINPALAISGMELINRLYDNPDYLAIMRDCSHTVMGVWSENSLDRTVVVAVYGSPTAPVPVISPNDPNPDYDASDELEYGLNWFPWILRGVHPAPAYPPQ